MEKKSSPKLASCWTNFGNILKRARSEHKIVNIFYIIGTTFTYFLAASQIFCDINIWTIHFPLSWLCLWNGYSNRHAMVWLNLNVIPLSHKVIPLFITWDQTLWGVNTYVLISEDFTSKMPCSFCHITMKLIKPKWFKLIKVWYEPTFNFQWNVNWATCNKHIPFIYCISWNM